MNIYIHVENVVRELDSKILLAILAASRGHQVIVSNLSSITRGVALRLLAPGIFHTKSLTPGEDKILRHQKLIDSGFNITSIDEEGGLVDYGYDKFAKIRYSEKTIDQSTAVFGWGIEDTDSLKRIFSKYSSKIYKTGSPRVDLWKPFFYNYWDIPKEKPSKPFLLISSNLGIANNNKSAFELMERHKNSGYYKRDPELIYKHLAWIADESRMMLCYIEAIKYLSKNNNLYDIVLRPHPSENEDMWKIFLDDIPNVHVIQKGPITNWVVHSFAVLHNGCTTSIEEADCFINNCIEEFVIIGIP
jgi:surface carbohydrate biosynthesis protein